MTHLEGNFYPNVILPTSPPTVPLTTHHYLSSGARQHKIIGVTNSCFFLLLFPGEIMLNIFFIDLLINRESEFLKGLCWTNPDVIGSRMLSTGEQLGLEGRFQKQKQHSRPHLLLPALWGDHGEQHPGVSGSHLPLPPPRGGARGACWLCSFLTLSTWLHCLGGGSLEGKVYAASLLGASRHDMG